MAGIPTSPRDITSAGRELLIWLWESITSSIWAVLSSALSPLSFVGKVGLLLGISTLALVGIQSYRQGYEGRVSQPTSLMGFASVILMIADFLPPKVLKGVLAFIGLGGAVGIYNLKSYFAGDQESTEWYDTYQRLFGSLTLAVILLILVLEYIVGIDLPLLP